MTSKKETPFTLSHTNAENAYVGESARMPEELEKQAKVYLSLARNALTHPRFGPVLSKNDGEFDTSEKRIAKLKSDIWLAREVYIQICKEFIARHEAEGTMTEKELRRPNRMRLTGSGHPGLFSKDTDMKKPDPIIFNEARKAIEAWQHSERTVDYNTTVDELYASALARWDKDKQDIADALRFHPAND